MEKAICISLGGSVVSQEKGVNVEYISKFLSVLSKCRSTKFIVVVGGGYVNNIYVDSLKGTVNSHLPLDEIGILISRVNAFAVKSFAEGKLDVYPNVICSVDEVQSALMSHNVVLSGGFHPGLTTDSSAILACEAAGIKKLINVSTIGYVYDRNPKESGAKKLPKLSYDQLIELAAKFDTRSARTHFIFDLVACKLAKRAKITINFVDEDIRNLENAILEKKYVGSTVK